MGRLPIEPALQALVDAWAERPTSEVAAFAASLVPGSGKHADADVDRSDVEAIREVAAVSGAVWPAELIGREGDADPRAEMLGGIATEFDRAVVDGRMKWTMRSAHRSTTLERLASTENGLRDALRRAERVETDPAGHVLRRLLREELDTDVEAARLPDHVVGEASTADVA